MSEANATTIGLTSGVSQAEQVMPKTKELIQPWAKEKVAPWLPVMTQVAQWFKEDNQSASKNMMECFVRQPEMAEALLGLTGEMVGTGDLNREALLTAYYTGLGLKPETVRQAVKYGGELMGLTEQLWSDGLSKEPMKRLQKLVDGLPLSEEARKATKQGLEQINLRVYEIAPIQSVMAQVKNVNLEDHVVHLEEELGDQPRPPKPPNWWDKFVNRVSRTYQKFIGRLASRGGIGQRLVRMLGASDDLKEMGYEITARALALAVTLGIGLCFYITTAPLSLRVEQTADPQAAAVNAITEFYGQDQAGNYQAASQFMADVLNGGNTMVSVKEHLVNIADFNNPRAKELFLVTVDAYRFELLNVGLDSRQGIYDYLVKQGYSGAEANYLADVGEQILQTTTGGNFQEYQDVFDQAGAWEGSLMPSKAATVSVNQQKSWQGKRYRGSKPVVTSKKPGQWF